MLSLPHLVLLFIVALIVFGPEKLPGLARTMGKVMAEFRKVTFDLRRVVEDEMREMDRSAREAEIRKKDAAAQQNLPGIPPTPVIDHSPAEALLPDAAVIAGQPGGPTGGGEASMSPPQQAENEVVPSMAPPGTVPGPRPNAPAGEAADVASNAADDPSSEPSTHVHSQSS
jgi:sec-independent protein translocase protein TatB